MRAPSALLLAMEGRVLLRMDRLCRDLAPAQPRCKRRRPSGAGPARADRGRCQHLAAAQVSRRPRLCRLPVGTGPELWPPRWRGAQVARADSKHSARAWREGESGRLVAGWRDGARAGWPCAAEHPLGDHAGFAAGRQSESHECVAAVRTGQRRARGRSAPACSDESSPAGTVHVNSEQVRWHCVVANEPDPQHRQSENIEVISSHFGMGANPAVLWAIADRLAQAEGHWQPFDRSGWRACIYGEPLEADSARLATS